ncbi:MAG: hypothetical protein ABIB97_03255 [Patescibacteria group bacterium]
MNEQQPASKNNKSIIIIVIVVVVLALGFGVYFYFFRADETNENANTNTNTVANQNQNINQNVNASLPAFTKTCDYDTDCELRLGCTEADCYNVAAAEVLYDCDKTLNPIVTDNLSCVCAEKECTVSEEEETTNTNQNANTNQSVNANTNQDVEATGSTTTPIDSTWNLYTNNDLGFSINIPVEAYFYYASCDWRDDSYRPGSGMVPVSTFATDDSVYINQEYLYELGGATEVGGITNYSECNRVENSVSRLSSEIRTWNIKVATVEDEVVLEDFINDTFGEGGCSLGDQTAWEHQDGVYEVRIETDGLDPEESRCFINYAVNIFYYPAGNKVMTWDLGQDISFPADSAVSAFYDTDMTNSFRFLE